MKTTILEHTGTDGFRATVLHLETQHAALPGGPRSDLIEVESNSDRSASTYDVLVKVARAIVAHEDRAECPPTRLLRMTEEELAWAVKVVLRHSTINVWNALLKAKGQL